MEPTKKYIVFQCYGNEGTFYECAYSLLSLSRMYSPEDLVNTEIWLYTDNPSFFQSFKDCSLPLHYRKLDAAVIKEWKGGINFVHRVKLEILREFTADRDGIVIYLDTDTVFLKRIDEIFIGIKNDESLYMHLLEGIVCNRENTILRKLDDHLQKSNTAPVNGKKINELGMWNAGMLGFDTWYRYLLDEALTFTDTEYPKFPKHIVEQFALSMSFQKEGNVKTAAPYILHYWNMKEARSVLGSFFNYFSDRSWAELVRYSDLVNMHVLMQEKISFLNNRTLLQKLLKKQWRPQKQDWAELVKQLG